MNVRTAAAQREGRHCHHQHQEYVAVAMSVRHLSSSGSLSTLLQTSTSFMFISRDVLGNRALKRFSSAVYAAVLCFEGLKPVLWLSPPFVSAWIDKAQFSDNLQRCVQRYSPSHTHNWSIWGGFWTECVLYSVIAQVCFIKYDPLSLMHGSGATLHKIEVQVF